jgi:Uma2 family endonuclease
MFDWFCEEWPELSFAGANEGFILRRDPDTLVSPDACRFRRRPELESTWHEFAPDIAVEVLSPSNSPAEMLHKRKAYFAAGTEQLWLVDPVKREIQFVHRDGRVVTTTGDASIDGEGIAAGMRILLTDILRER